MCAPATYNEVVGLLRSHSGVWAELSFGTSFWYLYQGVRGVLYPQTPPSAPLARVRGEQCDEQVLGRVTVAEQCMCVISAKHQTE